MDSNERPKDIPDSGLVFYVVKGTKTSTHNTVKTLILIEELKIPHQVYVVDRVSASWFEQINPHRMVPALEDRMPSSHEVIKVWESTSTLSYLADAYDYYGTWKGKDLKERADVGNWLTLHTAALGPTAKYWLYFHALHPEKITAVVAKLRENVAKQYDILEKRLNEPGQSYLALKDRPTIADIATLPFAMEETAELIGLDAQRWPKMKAWTERMNERPSVKTAWARVAAFGHSEEEMSVIAA